MLPIDHTEKPEKKGDKPWMLQSARIIAADFASQGHQMFAKNGGKYDLLRAHAMGKQPIGKYKKLKEIDEAATTSEYNVDWAIKGPGKKLCDIALEKILEPNYSPVATPIDILSRDENNTMYADIKTRLEMQQMAQQAQKEQGVQAGLEQNPMLQMQPGEPQDLEELQLRFEQGEQFNRAKDMEMVISLVFHETKVMPEKRPQFMRDIRDFGCAVYKEELDCNGRPTNRVVNPNNFGCSFCEDPNFRDIMYAFEFIQVPVGELKGKFDADEYEKIKSEAQWNRARNTFALNIGSNDATSLMSPKPGHVLVMDFELFSWEDWHWELGMSRYGNMQIKRTKPSKADDKKTAKMLYNGKWLVGSDHIYDYGLAKNMKRRYADKQQMMNTSLSFKPFAVNMYKMICSSFTEQLMPLNDDYMMNNIAIQNYRNNMVPDGWWFDLDALEGTALSHGGKEMTPQQLIKLFYRKGSMLGRSSGLSSQNVNLKPVEPLRNENIGKLMELISEKQSIIQEMRDVTGLNELTDGSTPGERTLNGVANLANTATNTALKPMIRCDKAILTELAIDSFFRVQQAVRAGGFSGFAPGLNPGTWKWVEADAQMSERDYAIDLDIRATEEIKTYIMDKMEQTFAAGLLDPTDIITLLNTYNLKQAQEIWTWKIKKNKETQRQQEVQNQLLTFQGQAESTERSEKAKQNTQKVIGWWDCRRQEIANKGLITAANIKVTNQPQQTDEGDDDLTDEERALYMPEEEVPQQQMP